VPCRSADRAACRAGVLWPAASIQCVKSLAGLLMHGARAHQAGCRHGPLPKSHLLSITQSTRTPAPIRICEFPSLPFPGQARQAIIVVSLIQRCMLRTDFPVGDYCGEHLVCSSCTGCRLCLCRAAVYTAQRTGDGEVNKYRYTCAAERNELSNVW
jgi:hypothetical protein